ncbi:MAG TPA: hypothetical protein VGA04_10425, partial [Streptosporangiaceae bacterium]
MGEPPRQQDVADFAGCLAPGRPTPGEPAEAHMSPSLNVDALAAIDVHVHAEVSSSGGSSL